MEILPCGPRIVFFTEVYFIPFGGVQLLEASHLSNFSFTGKHVTSTPHTLSFCSEKPTHFTVWNVAWERMKL